MATSVHPLFVLSKPAAEPYVEPSAEPDDDRLCIFSAEGAHSETPLTSEPPLPDAEPLTSEPPLSDAAPLTSESDAALDSGTTRP